MERRVNRQTHCFAPGCTSGYVSARNKGKKVSTFAAPSNEERLKVWQRAVPRTDRPLEKTSVLCELHFEQRFIVQDYIHVVNGETVRIPRGRPCLSEDAVSTLFRNTSSYLSKRLPVKRKSRTSRGEVLRKRRKGIDSSQCEFASFVADSTRDSVATDDDAAADGTGIHYACSREKLDKLAGENLPSEFWSRNVVAEAPKSLAFSVFSQPGVSVCFKKLVLCSAENTHYQCAVFVQGAALKQVDMFNPRGVENLLQLVDQMSVCPGFEQSLVPSELHRSRSRVNYRLHGNKLHSKDCQGVSQGEKPCIQCKYLRKLLVNQACYKKRKARAVPVSNTSKKLVKCNLQLRREKEKVAKLKTMMTAVKEENAAISEGKLEKSLSGLPEKQRQQVQACFQASKRKGTQGMTYSQE
ncbi:uncharacterized protein LOC144104537 [Amblyomma americanum]